MNEKRRLRNELGALRSALNAAQRTVASESAVAAVAMRPEFRSAGRIGLFAAFGSEADPLALERIAKSHALEVCYPRVVGSALVFAEALHAELVPGYRGILEPPEGHPSVPIASIDLILVPGLGFGRDGRRLGSGLGFYDRTLGNVQPRPLLVGFGFACQLRDGLPSEFHDVPLDRIATEAGVIACTERGISRGG